MNKGAERHAADDLYRPGGIVEVGCVAGLITDDILVDADVGNQLHARPDRIDDEHQSEKRR